MRHWGSKHRLPRIMVTARVFVRLDGAVRCIGQTNYHSMVGGCTEVLDTQRRVQFRNAECRQQCPGEYDLLEGRVAPASRAGRSCASEVSKVTPLANLGRNLGGEFGGLDVPRLKDLDKKSPCARLLDMLRHARSSAPCTVQSRAPRATLTLRPVVRTSLDFLAR